MGCVSTAIELLFSENSSDASRLAEELCQLNRRRQHIENEIYKEAISILESTEPRSVIVLASRSWHSGVVGIVASRLAEQFGRAAFLICLDGEMGKGSARSAGGLNLVETLASVSDLLAAYGGHELAAGFSITEGNIASFEQNLCALVDTHVAKAHTLSVDATLPPSLFSMSNVTELRVLEPCGMGNASPVFCLEDVRLDEVRPVGGGRHVRLFFSRDGLAFQGIYFGMDALSLGFFEDDSVDIAFHAEINTFQNRSHVQFLLCDIRLAMPYRAIETQEQALYSAFLAGRPLTGTEAALLSPTREDLAAVWRHLVRATSVTPVTASLTALSRKIMREAGLPYSFAKVAVALDAFRELSLIERWHVGSEVTIETASPRKKADLASSPTLAKLHTMITVQEAL
jgi:single-stranded-DNA-specific exonuclease